jgi:hypothetical protein
MDRPRGLAGRCRAAHAATPTGPTRSGPCVAIFEQRTEPGTGVCGAEWPAFGETTEKYSIDFRGPTLLRAEMRDVDGTAVYELMCFAGDDASLMAAGNFVYTGGLQCGLNVVGTPAMALMESRSPTLRRGDCLLLQRHFPRPRNRRRLCELSRLRKSAAIQNARVSTGATIGGCQRRWGICRRKGIYGKTPPYGS